MTTRSNTPAPRGLGWLALLYAGTFLLGAALHAGFEVPLGFTVLTEPTILPATIVETLCGVALMTAAVAMLRAQRRWWAVAVTGHAVALGGVLLGVVATRFGPGSGTSLNDAYHAVMLVALSLSLGLLIGRRRLGTRGHAQPAA